MKKYLLVGWVLLTVGCTVATPTGTPVVEQVEATAAVPVTIAPAVQTTAVLVPPPATVPAVETAVPEAVATEVPAVASATTTSEAEVALQGRTEEGAYFLGRADAPVTIIDYSDFM